MALEKDEISILSYKEDSMALEKDVTISILCSGEDLLTLVKTMKIYI